MCSLEVEPTTVRSSPNRTNRDGQRLEPKELSRDKCATRDWTGYFLKDATLFLRLRSEKVAPFGAARMEVLVLVGKQPQGEPWGECTRGVLPENPQVERSISTGVSRPGGRVGADTSVWSRRLHCGVGPISNGSNTANRSHRRPIDEHASGNPSVRSRERCVFPGQVLITDVPGFSPLVPGSSPLYGSPRSRGARNAREILLRFERVE